MSLSAPPKIWFRAVLCLAGAGLLAQAPPSESQFTPEQLDRMVAPIAAYPEQLLQQVFMAATHPLQIFEAHQWLRQNPRLQGLALLNAAQHWNWDTSVQVLLLFPDVLNVLATHIRWISAVGNAFLTQKEDLMDAVERVRSRTQSAGGGLAPRSY
ncbi:MAG TPA: DUF3300 domain-containing protein [Bryobacteraceae bacterium]|nr:DUF3300 domain-containing protein [Bryobacteraceae bacterium]